MTQYSFRTDRFHTRHRTVRVALFLMTVLTLLSFLVPGWTHGGTNGLLDRMTSMYSEMGKTGELTPDQVAFYQKKVESLRAQVDQRIQESGDLNPIKDKDLYDLINKYNQPLFDAYQKSKAKIQFDPRRITEDQ